MVKRRCLLCSGSNSNSNFVSRLQFEERNKQLTHVYMIIYPNTLSLVVFASHPPPPPTLHHLLNFHFQTCLQSLSRPLLLSSAPCLCPALRRTLERGFCVNWVSEKFVTNGTHTYRQMCFLSATEYLSNRWCVMPFRCNLLLPAAQILQLSLLAQRLMTHLVSFNHLGH